MKLSHSLKTIKLKGGNMKDVIKDIIKWGIIIVIGAIAFYVVYPKYEVVMTTGAACVRYNKFTGETERKIVFNDEKNWETIK
jgi:hypothetical protein